MTTEGPNVSKPDAMTFGFRILGSVANDRRLIDWPAAFVAHAECDTRAETSRESYLSAFCFGDDFREHLTSTRSVRGFVGATWSRWVWFDIDRDDLDAALTDGRRLVAGVADRYRLDGDDLLIFFSGSKGFHVGLSTSVFDGAIASTSFHAVARHFAEATAARCGVVIDPAVYDRVRAFRSPNSRHPKTGRHKRRLMVGELMHLTAGRIVELAAEPQAFDVPDPLDAVDIATSDWLEAVKAVEQQREAVQQRREAGTPARLNRSTLAFIRDGAAEGDRHRRLFSAAANLAEFGCPPDLAAELLTEAALDSGLSPAEVRRQIECGLTHTQKA
jgi:hypothetical protein